MQVRKQQLELDMEIGKGVHQGCILSPCLFNLYVEYIMRNAVQEQLDRDPLEHLFLMLDRV